jgi:hypothetical protein
MQKINEIKEVGVQLIEHVMSLLFVVVHQMCEVFTFPRESRSCIQTWCFIMHNEMNTHYYSSWHDLEEKLTSKKPNITHLIMFGYIDYVHAFNEKNNKIRPKG